METYSGTQKNSITVILTRENEYFYIRGKAKIMAEVKWIKILVDIFDDEAIKLIESMPDGDTLLIIWFKLLAKAGKINDGGLVYFKENIPYTEEMLSTVFKRPISTIRLAMQTFIQFGLIELNDSQQILIKNWEKHQNLEKLEMIKAGTRARVARHRERKKEEQRLLSCNVTVTQSNAQEEEKEEEKENILLEEEVENSFPDSHKFYGEYCNVGLTDEQYGRLLTITMSKKAIDLLVIDLGKAIETGKEKRFTYDLPNLHFERLLAYWKYRRMNPQKFKDNEPACVPENDSEILSLNDAMEHFNKAV